MALIERGRTRHIVNLPDMLAACKSELSVAGSKPACSALSFDGVQDFPGLLQELQTVDVLVMPTEKRASCHTRHFPCSLYVTAPSTPCGQHKRPEGCQRRAIHAMTLMHVALAWL